MATMSPGVFVERTVAWVRSAYPDGVPSADRRGLIDVLGERLTSDELDLVVRLLPEIVGDGQVADDAPVPALGEAEYAAVTSLDRYRVAGRLAAGGWPLAEVEVA